jgi:hypothetical protein
MDIQLVPTLQSEVDLGPKLWQPTMERGEKPVLFNLTVTPIVEHGCEIAPATWTLSEDDVANTLLGEFLREIILDWGRIAREIDELVQAQ